ncbi:hypothetical protein HYY69_02590 [Candidatus Woesearchaeota archaeon]|nr:hypothetical protein [Candidatus Woesearchaeota archaeon]
MINKATIDAAWKYALGKNIVALGTLFMDLKLGEAQQKHILQQHAKMSSDAAKVFLEQHKVNNDLITKVLNCIEAHHAEIPFTCKEAEICANADCYRFLHPKGIYAYLHMFGMRGMDFSKALKQVQNKADEKWRILTLPVCKQELEPYYKTLKQWLKLSASV